MLIGQDPILEADNEVNLTHSLGTGRCGGLPRGKLCYWHPTGGALDSERAKHRCLLHKE